MIFWTLFLLTVYVVMLFRGSFMTDMLIKYGELEIKKAEENKKVDSSDIESKHALGIVFNLFLIAAQLIYLVSAISFDTYKYPTVALIAYTILSFAFSKKTKKKDLTTEEGRNEYRKHLYQNCRKFTFKSTLIRLGYVAYFGYMFYLLVF